MMKGGRIDIDRRSRKNRLPIKGRSIGSMRVDKKNYEKGVYKHNGSIYINLFSIFRSFVKKDFVKFLEEYLEKDKKIEGTYTDLKVGLEYYLDERKITKTRLEDFRKFFWELDNVLEKENEGFIEFEWPFGWGDSGLKYLRYMKIKSFDREYYKKVGDKINWNLAVYKVGDRVL